MNKSAGNLTLIIVALLMAGCYHTYKDHAYHTQDGIIHRDTMVVVLADVEIAESALREMQNVGKETGELKEAYYHSIFRKHGISKEQFDSSLLYYRKDPSVMDKIYEDVITRLSKMESEVKLEGEEEDPS